MIGFILGAAGSGKTEEVTKRVLALASSGESSLILMPEQTSFEYERAFSLAAEPASRAYISVSNFKKLAADADKRCGGTAVSQLTSGGAAAVVRRCVQKSPDSIRIYGRAAKDADLCLRLAQTVTELRDGGITPEMLEAAAGTAASRVSADKYRELAQILRSYDGYLGGGWSDEARKYTGAAQKLEQSGLVAGRHVFIDGFTWFSEPEFTLVRAIMRLAENVTFVMFDDGAERADDIFEPAQQTRARITAAAGEMGIAVQAPSVLKDSVRYAAAGLRDAERWFAGVKKEEISPEGLYSFTGSDPYDEAEKAAAEIAYLVREQGWRYRDFQIGVRDMAGYSPVLSRVFKRFEIPVFFDTRTTLQSAQFITFAKTAVLLSGSLDTEKILTIACGPYSPLTEDEAQALENYAFVWNLKGSEFRAPFTRNPLGLKAVDAAGERELEKLEAVRLKLMEPLLAYTGRARSRNARNMIEGIYDLFKAFGAEERLESSGDPEDVRQCSAGFAVLDSLYRILGDDTVSPEELAALINIEASTEDLGDIPSSLDEVTVSQVTRMRAASPKAVFIMGLVSGKFPAEEFDARLLSFRERDELNAQGGNLSLNFDSLLQNEKLYLYSAVCAPSHRLYLSHPERTVKGDETPICSEADWFIKNANPSAPSCYAVAEPRVVNRKTALAVLAEELAKNESPVAAEAAGGEEQIRNAAAEPSYAIHDTELASKTVGERLWLTPTGIENFEKCPFYYFMNHMLKIRKPRQARIDALEAGSFIHGVLEKAMLRTQGDLRKIDEDQVPAFTRDCAEEYMSEELPGDAAADGRTAATAERLIQQAERLIGRLRQERLVSDFAPKEFEYTIGEDGKSPPMVLNAADGREILVGGKIDRVDEYRSGGQTYLRVVDYKTGEKDFKRADVNDGISLQMLIYLFALCRNGPVEYRGAVPAGVLYMPADPKPAGPGEDPEKPYRMDGLVLNEDEIVRAMDRECSYRFVPVAFTKDGSISGNSRSHLATRDEFREISDIVDGTITDMADRLIGGDIEAYPLVKTKVCDYCDYRGVCRKDRVLRKRGEEAEDESDGQD